MCVYELTYTQRHFVCGCVRACACRRSVELPNEGTACAVLNTIVTVHDADTIHKVVSHKTIKRHECLRMLA